VEKVIKRQLEATAKNLYPFAYALCLDELMASQLVIDGLSRFAIEFEQAPCDENKLETYKSLYLLAKHRHHHTSIKSSKVFSSLSFLGRATLFLIEKEKWMIDDVAYVCTEESSHIRLAIHEARGILSPIQESII